MPAGSGDTSGQWTSGIAGLGESFLLGLANVTEASAAPLIRAVLMRLLSFVRGLPLEAGRQNRPTTPLSRVPDVGKSSRDILAPNGAVVGYRFGRAGRGIQTVTKSEFERLKAELIEGSTLVHTDNPFPRVYVRPDGLRFAVRTSLRHRETIDIIEDFSSTELKKLYYR